MSVKTRKVSVGSVEGLRFQFGPKVPNATISALVGCLGTEMRRYCCFRGWGEGLERE
jgi:hypothetical protein